MPNALTVTALRARWRGDDLWLSDGGSRGSGRLVARITREGTHLYFQHFHNGKRRWWPIGPYAERGTDKPADGEALSLVGARAKAAELAALYRSGVTDLHGHFAKEREARERAAREAEEAARRAAEDAKRGTLAQMCDAYTEHLKRQRKQSASDVANIFRHHVLEADPALAARRAAEITPEECAGLIGRLVDKGKGRAAAKLRAYLRAAYGLAAASHTDPTAPLALRTFGIRANPLSGIPALAKYSRARDRVLNAPELTAFMRHVEALPEGANRDAIALTLYLGGQRPAQLLRLRAADVDLAGATVALYDSKGKRSAPRLHTLPLTREALAIVERRLAGLSGDDRVFTTRPETLSAVVADISAEMVEAKEAREAFQLRDLRRTCETMLASLSVSSDVRAQLQSHGLGGVQHRHYDRHDYMPEKRRALDLWAAHLRRLRDGEQSNVVPMVRPASA